ATLGFPLSGFGRTASNGFQITWPRYPDEFASVRLGANATGISTNWILGRASCLAARLDDEVAPESGKTESQCVNRQTFGQGISARVSGRDGRCHSSPLA